MAFGPDHKIAQLAACQEGAFSYRQVRVVGFSDRMIEHRVGAGRWHRIERSVFVLAGSQSTWKQRLFTAVPAAGPGSVVSHRAAAELYGLGRFRQPIEITTPRPRRYRSDEVIVHTSKQLQPVDRTSSDGLPLTTPTRTLIDLGAGTRPDRVEEALNIALREELTTLGEVSVRLAALRKSGRNGTGVLAAVLGRAISGPLPESRYEQLFLRAIENAGLPIPDLQVEIRDGTLLLGRVDAAWREHRLAVEIDGHHYHATRQQRARDAERENAIKLAGWRVLRFTTDQVWERPDWVGATTRRALELR